MTCARMATTDSRMVSSRVDLQELRATCVARCVRRDCSEKTMSSEIATPDAAPMGIPRPTVEDCQFRRIALARLNAGKGLPRLKGFCTSRLRPGYDMPVSNLEASFG